MNGSTSARAGTSLEGLDGATLAELTRRLRDIDRSYREAAEKMGQLYMFANGNRAAALARRLDQPMRNASHNEQALAALLDELRLVADGGRPKRRGR